MKISKFLLSIVFLLICTSTQAEQHIGGLVIDYSPHFKKDIATAKQWMSGLPKNVRQLVVSMEIYLAKATNGLGEVRLMKIRYVPELNGNIDGAANESAQRVSALEGIKNFRKSIKSISVSGLPARQVSIAADRWGGKLGGETLVVYNRSTNDMWQMQLTFAKKKGINPFASLNVDEERNYAKHLLSTIKVSR